MHAAKLDLPDIDRIQHEDARTEMLCGFLRCDCWEITDANGRVGYLIRDTSNQNTAVDWGKGCEWVDSAPTLEEDLALCDLLGR